MGYKKKYKKALIKISALEHRIIEMEYYKWIKQQREEFYKKHNNNSQLKEPI